MPKLRSPHGTRTRYKNRCRCEKCREAQRRHKLERKNDPEKHKMDLKTSRNWKERNRAANRARDRSYFKFGPITRPESPFDRFMRRDGREREGGA